MTTEEAIAELGKEMKDIKTMQQDTLEIVHFIKDNAATKKELEELRTELKNELKNDISSLSTEVTSLSTKVARIESSMVTKSYLDEKLANIKGDNVSLIRKEDDKVNAIIEELDTQHTLPKASITTIKSHHVFPAPPIISASI